MGVEWNCNTKMEHSCGYGRWVTGVEEGSGLDMELDMGSGHGKHGCEAEVQVGSGMAID